MLNLIEQVSQIAPVGGAVLDALRREILAIDGGWTRVYSDYHTGGWLTLSLLNSTGDAADTIIADCTPVETSLLGSMPQTRDFLRSLGLKYMWVRLAKFEPNAFFWEHRDYQEVERVGRFRLHIPVITSPACSMIISDVKIHLAGGYIWKLNPMHRHAASNLGAQERVHILADCYSDDALDRLVAAEYLDERWVAELPPPPPGALDDALGTSLTLARQGRHTEAEHLLLKLYHEYRLGEGECYDLVAGMYQKLGDRARQEQWEENKLRFLGPGTR